MTMKQLFDYMDETIGIEVTLVSCGKFALYNAYLPGKKHAPRLEMKVEDVYKQVSQEELQEGRNWLHIELGGSVKNIDDTDF
jgi:hypothetical protein